ncbi:MAG: c-type cytochrome biogenesis protein CcmI [Shimia sp.]
MARALSPMGRDAYIRAMFGFLIACALTVLLVCLSVWAGARRGAPEAAARDLDVYRAQLDEVERDLARGTVTAEEAAQLRLEVQRRLLAADRAGAAAPRREGARWGPVAGLAGAVAVTVAAYLWVGAPGYGDQPLAARQAAALEAAAQRPAQAVAARAAASLRAPVTPNPRHVALVAQLREALETRPDDAQGLALLARNEALLGNFEAAAAAQRRAIGAAGGGAEAFSDLAEILILDASGYVSPEAEAALRAAAADDPGHPQTRYYLGLLYDQIGRPDLAFRQWRPLAEAQDPNAPWTAPVYGQIERIAQQAGIRYTVPEMPDGAAIAAMVEGLADRLATDGGPPEDWGRLIVARAVQGDAERAAAILAEARRVFSDVPEARDVLDAAADRAGLGG